MSRAPTVTEERSYPPYRTRERCTKCGKVAYPTRSRSESAAERISQRTPMRAYYSRRCGWWHVTRKGAARLRTAQRRASQARKRDPAADHWHASLNDPRAGGVVIPSHGRGFRPR